MSGKPSTYDNNGYGGDGEVEGGKLDFFKNLYSKNKKPVTECVDLYAVDNTKADDVSAITGEEEEEDREHWGSKWEFILSCVGLSVGIGNVWRFPTLAYQNGGGSFLIPYFIILLLIGKPMYYMELALGQFVQRGPVAAWKLCPLGYGIGVAQCTVSLIVAIYYNVIMSYTLYYIFASFQSEVPWAKCSEDWFQGVGADEHCYERKDLINNTGSPCASEDGVCETSAEQFFKRAVLGSHLSHLTNVTELIQDENGTEFFRTSRFALSEVGNIGEIKWDITLCLLLAWIIVCACLIKGVKSSGKVVYFTATFPYLLLIILLVYGCTLEGAYDGIQAFFIPEEWSGPGSIQDPQVWRKAAEQMFFSLSVSWGGLVMFGSYNKFDHKVHITATAISSLDFITSIIAGVVIFTILGELKREAGLDSIKEVVKGGTGLAFIAYPEALSRLPVPQLWSVMFFFMLFLLGLDSEFALLETVLTAFYDGIPKTNRFKPLMVISICAFCFLLSLPAVSYSGTFVFQIMDDYGGGMSVMWIAIIEMAFIMWIYGVRNFTFDLDFMLKTGQGCTGKISSYILQFLWVVIPILLSIILGFSLYSAEKPIYKDALGDIRYPDYAHGIGFFLVLIAVLQIPFWGFVMFCYYLCSPGRKLSDVVKPTDEWGPGERKAFKQYKELKQQMNRGKRRPKRGANNPIQGYDAHMVPAQYYHYGNQNYM